MSKLYMRYHYSHINLTQNFIRGKAKNLRVGCRCGDPVRDNKGNVKGKGREPVLAVQTAEYDPWGLDFGTATVSPSGGGGQPYEDLQHGYLYNSKEKLTDLGLNLYEYGFRWHDPQLGRFVQVDPLAMDYAYKSTYDYAENDPSSSIDLDGLEKVRHPSAFRSFYLGAIGDINVARAEIFAANNGIDASQMFIFNTVRARNGLRAGYGSSVIIVEEKDGELYKHVFRSSKRGVYNLLSTKNDDLYQKWDLNFDLNNNPIPNEEDLADGIVDAPIGVPGKGVGNMVINGSKSIYPLLKGPLHHIFTNKNYKAGMQWSKQFQPLFEKAGYTLNDAINKVYVPGHSGRHSNAYHKYVYDFLIQSTKGLKDKDYIKAFDSALSSLAKQIQDKGSELNKLLVK